MAQDFDKIFKENIEEIILPLAEKLFDIHPFKLEEIPGDLQITHERKPDFLKKVLTKENVPEYILHIEFQKEDDPKMAGRMLEYWAMLYSKYGLRSRQYVIYIDKKLPKMPVAINYEELHFNFHLVNMQDIDYNILIRSDKPEEIILGVLGNFGSDKPGTALDNILNRIKSVAIETNRRDKCVKQLEVFSKLRNLQSELIEKLANMALTYDLETDIRYLQGEEKILINFLKKSSLSMEEIAKIAEVPLDYVKKIAEKLKNK